MIPLNIPSASVAKVGLLQFMSANHQSTNSSQTKKNAEKYWWKVWKISCSSKWNANANSQKLPTIMSGIFKNISGETKNEMTGHSIFSRTVPDFNGLSHI